MSGEDKSLLERVEFPTIPKDAAKKIAHLQEEFLRAEVEQRTFFLYFDFCFVTFWRWDWMR